MSEVHPVGGEAARGELIARVIHVYRKPAPIDLPTHEKLVQEIGEALKRVSLTGWSIRRIDATTWEVADAREPSGTWVHFYRVIVFAEPRGILVLHGNHDAAKNPWQERGRWEGRFMRDVGSSGLPRFSLEFESAEAFLGAMFRSLPPNTRLAQKKPPSRPDEPARPFEEIFMRTVDFYRLRERFEVRRQGDDVFCLVPLDDRNSVLTYDYIITRTSEPDGVLVSCENHDGGFVLVRSEHVVYVEREGLLGDWLPWVLRHKEPNRWGYS